MQCIVLVKELTTGARFAEAAEVWKGREPKEQAPQTKGEIAKQALGSVLWYLPLVQLAQLASSSRLCHSVFIRCLEKEQKRLADLALSGKSGFPLSRTLFGVWRMCSPEYVQSGGILREMAACACARATEFPDPPGDPEGKRPYKALPQQPGLPSCASQLRLYTSDVGKGHVVMQLRVITCPHVFGKSQQGLEFTWDWSRKAGRAPLKVRVLRCGKGPEDVAPLQGLLLLLLLGKDNLPYWYKKVLPRIMEFHNACLCPLPDLELALCPMCAKVDAWAPLLADGAQKRSPSVKVAWLKKGEGCANCTREHVSYDAGADESLFTWTTCEELTVFC